LAGTTHEVLEMAAILDDGFAISSDDGDGLSGIERIFCVFDLRAMLPGTFTKSYFAAADGPLTLYNQQCHTKPPP
jgi:hypothetical protein